MQSVVCLFGAFIAAAVFHPGSCVETVIGLYGETIEVPCNNGNNKPDGLIFTKWKYVKDDGSPGDLLVKQAQKDEATVSATDGYKSRVSIAANSSLLITRGSLADQRVFTCMVVSLTNLEEHSVEVKVHKKPSAPVIKNNAKELENDKLTQLGECVVENANPPADLIWMKNDQPLVDDGKMIIITSAITKDPVTGLSSTSSRLQYTARKEDVESQFTCTAKHEMGPDQVSEPETFPIHYPTEKVSLQVISQSPVREGDDVTLKCQADGNPPPTSFNFNIKGKKVMVTDKDVYTLTGVTRADSGIYKCSLLDNDVMESTQFVTVSFLDVSLTPTGKVLKKLGENLMVSLEKNASSEAKVTWTKDNRKLDKLPDFSKLTYSDAGLYVCDVSIEGIKRSLSFELTVEGIPKITSLTKHRSNDGKHKVLTCEAEGSPKPDVQWSVNGTNDEMSYVNGKATYKLTVVPSKNLTVSCFVTNKLGEDTKEISVFSLFEEDTSIPEKNEDGAEQAKVIVGVVVGLLVAAALVGLTYWLYIKKTRQGSWKTGEKETGTSEESKKLEENNHKADV
ncbi:CD166 antigen homolog isoform X1 [Sinocyclocheilus anshuiensis]|uniref:CD166 antigen homolog isoform X1 n=1 Tax=Sinocyclocheilus anshuiensis TaxID=1608454 RepID=UPI0007B97AEE|nr:PREDICTED: CD166 antigen homolog isoform X1 [Sinocyclocheilus anshuiensis]